MDAQAEERPLVTHPIDWNDFDDYTPLDEIEINADYETDPSDRLAGNRHDHRDRPLSLTGQAASRDAAPPADTRQHALGGCAEDLELILSPLEATEQEFEIDLRSDWPEHETFTGPVPLRPCSR